MCVRSAGKLRSESEETRMIKTIKKYYCDLCELEITTTKKKELPRVPVQAVEKAITVEGEKVTRLRNVDIHMCKECTETYMSTLPVELKYNGVNGKTVWRDNLKY